MAQGKRIGVVGLGTMGAQAAWRLAARGAEVVGFDRFAPGHDRGAAGGETRVFRFGHFEDTRYLPIVRHADALWQRLEADTGRRLRTRTGCLFLGPRDDLMATLLESLESDDHEVLDTTAAAVRFPQFRLGGADVAVLDRGGGWLRPELTVLTAARHAERLGARLHPYVPVRAVEPVRGGVAIHTDGGVERVDAVVVSAGPWVADVLPDLGRRVEVKRLVNAWFADPGGLRVPFLWLSPTHFYGVPSPDGISVKLGLSRGFHAPVEDPGQVDRTVAPEELRTFTELLAEHLPGLDPAPLRLSVYLEGYTAGGHPMIGHVDENIVVAAGFSGHGFKWSPAIGDIAADLALTGRTPLPIDFLSPTAPVDRSNDRND